MRQRLLNPRRPTTERRSISAAPRVEGRNNREQALPTNRRLPISAVLILAMTATSTLADASKPSADAAKPAFATQTEKPDGSVAMTIGRRLPTDWETRIGADVQLARPAGVALSDNLANGGAPQTSTGALWGSIALPSVLPLAGGAATVDARVDPSKDEAKLGAVLKHSVALGAGVSVTVQNDSALTHTLPSATATAGSRPPALPLTTGVAAADPATSGDTSAIWSTGQTLRLNIARSGTTLSASAATTTIDDGWHHKLSAEQILIGPFKVTAAIEDALGTTAKKSIMAGFRHTW
jgi:hypothetical protein